MSPARTIQTADCRSSGAVVQAQPPVTLVCPAAPAAPEAFPIAPPAPLAAAPAAPLEPAVPDEVPVEPAAPVAVPVVPAPEAPAAPVTETTVDALLEQLNAADMGGIKTGDRFRLTGELFMSDLWITGVSGDYFVLLKAQGGAQDLMVIVDKSDAAAWRDGTKVDMTVESVEITNSGETTGGWLKAQSVTVIP